MTNYLGRDAVIVGAVRTPIGKGKASGALHAPVWTRRRSTTSSPVPSLR